MRSMFSMDGKQWVYGDAFGVTRVDLGKQLKVSKHTIKLSCPIGALSMTLDGKLGMSAPGRYQTGAYGHDGSVTFGLPALGPKLTLSGQRPAGVMTSAVGDRVVTSEGGELVVSELGPKELVRERTIKLMTVTRLADLTLCADDATPAKGSAQEALRLMPDGRYALLSSSGMLYAGRVSDAAYNDEEWWAVQLHADARSQRAVEIVGESVWVTVMDHAAETAYVAHITKAGVTATHALPALAPPAFTATHLLYQPSSGEVRRRELATGREESFDVGHHNVHPQPDHGDEVYKGSPRPAAPTRLPGHLAANDKLMFFVPWHGEFIVNLANDAVYERGLESGPGAFRRMVLEIIARDNEALRQLQCQVQLTGFDHSPKRSSSPFAVELPTLPDTLTGAVATSLLHDLSDRFELQAGGWRWGGLSYGGGSHWMREAVSLTECRDVLTWMQGVDVIPFELTRGLKDMYSRRLGIPSESNVKDPVLLGDRAERLYLRAMLETIRIGGWPSGSIPAAWADEPITPQLACDAIEGFKSWRRRVPYHGLELLCQILTAHMGTAAIEPLLKLAADFPDPINWQQYRNAGECLVWLCNKHPQHKASALAAWDAINHPATSGNSNWVYEGAMVRAALERGAKHLWSNG
jgi:hypothetical protein